MINQWCQWYVETVGLSGALYVQNTRGRGELVYRSTCDADDDFWLRSDLHTFLRGTEVVGCSGTEGHAADNASGMTTLEYASVLEQAFAPNKVVITATISRIHHTLNEGVPEVPHDRRRTDRHITIVQVSAAPGE